jgi:MFS family permease
LTETGHSFARSEIGPILIVSLVSALRLLGIFLILPVFSAYAVNYRGATLALAGTAFGIYALTQCIFQIPLGWASDRWGRRPALLGGLALFTLGSLGCALANDILQLILARALQGSGAVGSVALAALADLTRPTVRTQAFTIAGIAIGSAFIIGLLGGPLLAAKFGFSGLFYILATLAFLSMILAAVSFPEQAKSQRGETPLGLRPIMRNAELRPIFIAAFILSFALNLFFFTYPLSWIDVGFEKSELWKVYLIVFLPSAVFVFPYVRIAERRSRLRFPTLVGWLTATVGYALYLFAAGHQLLLYVSGACFFFGYSLYQPLLPSFLTQRIPIGGRGTATSLYALFGFVGSSLGGIMAGTLSHVEPSLPKLVGVTLLLVWLTAGLPNAPEPGA